MRVIDIFSLLLPFMGVATASVGGHCTGKHATGEWKLSGICVSTGDCSHYHGKTTDNACPDDGDDIKCCVVGVYPDEAVNPCGDDSSCQWLDGGDCPAGLSGPYRNHCPGGDNFSCCRL